MVTRTQYSTCITSPSPVKGNTVATSRTVKVMSGSRELPMPNITYITTLSQAHATLLHCWMQLSRFVREAATVAANSPQKRAVDEERRYFQQWLNQWEAAFTAFLSAAVSSMAAEDIAQSRILKTNHLACTILAAEAGPSGFDAFESEFQAIVELAGAVLRARQQTQTASHSSNGAAAPLRGLDVREPLNVLLARCRHEITRTRARELLARFYPTEAA